MIRRGDFKLLYNMAAPHQLFDIRHDPHELHNLAAVQQTVVRELESELRRLCSPEVENQRAFAYERDLARTVRQNWDLEIPG